MSLNFTGSTPLWIVLLFAAGLVCIIKGGDLFVDAASWIAEASGIPKFIIGATIVSFATTLPEMLVSVFAALEGNADIAVGNAVGSVTANTGLIMCLSLVCMTCLMEPQAVRREGLSCCWRPFWRTVRLHPGRPALRSRSRLLILIIFARFPGGKHPLRPPGTGHGGRKAVEKRQKVSVHYRGGLHRQIRIGRGGHRAGGAAAH